MNRQYHLKKSGDLFMTLSSKNSKNIERLANEATLWKFYALCDITYVYLGNGTLLHGLKDKIWPAYQEVQASNMSKACKTEEEAIQSVSQRSKEQGEACHFEKIEEGRYIVYRTRDRKVLKSLSYFRPDLIKFFSDDEITKTRPPQHVGI